MRPATFMTICLRPSVPPLKRSRTSSETQTLQTENFEHGQTQQTENSENAKEEQTAHAAQAQQTEKDGVGCARSDQCLASGSVAEGNAAGGNANADTAEDERSHGSLSQRTLPWDSSQNE